PEAVTRRPWEALQAAGVDLRCGQEVAAGELAALAGQFDAVVLAAGASTPLRLPIPGADLDGVWDATRFLTEAHAALAAGTDLAALQPRQPPADGGPGDPAATVLVLGAGNTAMDVARSARRLGARAICVDWMDKKYAPVRPDELDEAAAEGVEVRFSTTVQRLEGVDGHVTSAHLARTRQRSAQQRPEVLAGTTTADAVDLVVIAMGYRIAPELAEAAAGTPVAKTTGDIPDRRWQASGILANPSPGFARHQPVGRLALGREHGRAVAGVARRDRMWVAGDALVGPSTVVEAMAQGRHAAQAILHHQPRRPGRTQRPTPGCSSPSTPKPPPLAAP
ncbi:MAG: FAD-dependent oxidoreductase, partial [Actinomycetota bacterium]|nr:FAD-dependent oxidoreductase [Actinomycetota bacterium]